VKVLVIGNETRYEQYRPKDVPLAQSAEICYCAWGTSDEEILARASDADFLAFDAMAGVSRTLIENMPNLKLVHSEGVGYQGVCTEALVERNIPLCNCKGVNAGAVAEQTILLLMMLLRDSINGHNAVVQGKQIETKERKMVEGIREVSDCKIGLIGFGDIAKATAKRLIPFDTKVYYYAPHKKSPAVEQEYLVEYLPLDELLATCDVISLHAPANEETHHMVNGDFLQKVRPGALLINTSRGDLVDNAAVVKALKDGAIGGAAFDTIDPEPVKEDDPLVDLPEGVKEKVIYSPHIGGITTSTFVRAHHMLWQAFDDVANGKEPKNRVL